jgi:hypothetical protein
LLIIVVLIAKPFHIDTEDYITPLETGARGG